MKAAIACCLLILLSSFPVAARGKQELPEDSLEGRDDPRGRTVVFEEDPALIEARLRMVSGQIEAREIDDPRVLKAMRSVPRHLFMPEVTRSRAYEDHAVPIGDGQTISQPYIVALMTESLELESDF